MNVLNVNYVRKIPIVVLLMNEVINENRTCDSVMIAIKMKKAIRKANPPTKAKNLNLMKSARNVEFPVKN